MVLLDRVESMVHTVLQGSVVAMAFGAKGELPSIDKALEEFENMLNEEPRTLDPIDVELRSVLGLTRV